MAIEIILGKVESIKVLTKPRPSNTDYLPDHC